MIQMQKKILELLVALFVAVIFITGYLASANITGGAPQGSSSSKGKGAPQTVYAFGFTNGTIVNYTNELNISISCKNSTTLVNNLTSTISYLEAHNNVSTYFQDGGNITILDGTEATNSLYLQLGSAVTNSTSNCVKFSTGAVLSLPSPVKLYVQSQSVSLQLGGAADRYIVPITLANNMSAKVHVRVAALLTSNGSVYGNLSVTKTT